MRIVKGLAIVPVLMRSTGDGSHLIVEISLPGNVISHS